MSASKLGLAAFVLAIGFGSSAHAQYYQGGYGVGVNNGIGVYGAPGLYSGYGGYGSYGYGRSRSYNRYYTRYPVNVPQTYNNLGGLMNTIRTNTGRPGSYRYSSNYGVSRRRFAR